MIGTGYVGLVSGVCFSDFGHDVVCVDKIAAKVDTLLAGGVPGAAGGSPSGHSPRQRAGCPPCLPLGSADLRLVLSGLASCSFWRKKKLFL